MPFIIGGFLLQLLLVVHAMKTGRDRLWVYLLLMAPGIGGLAYLIVELLPELMQTRGARTATRRAMHAVDPDRDMRDAVKALEVSDTVGNALRVARCCIDRGDFAQALELLSRKQTGVHQYDPDLMVCLAEAKFGLNDHQGVIETLDALKRENPDFKSPEGHMIYARAKEAIGDLDAAKHEYRALCDYYYGPEPVIRYADLLLAGGEAARAAKGYQSVIDEAAIAGKQYNKRHKDWIAKARAGVQNADRALRESVGA